MEEDFFVQEIYRFFPNKEEMDKYYEDKKKKKIKNISPKVIIVNKLPFKWALAINLFGKVYAIRELKEIELQHELIHSLQMKDLGYIKFYILYLYEWIKLAIKCKSILEGYKQISFEKEAYTYQNDVDYIINKVDYVWKKSWNIR